MIPDWNDSGEDTTSIVDEWGKIVWLRPDKITGMKEPILLFDKGIEPMNRGERHSVIPGRGCAKHNVLSRD